MNTELCLEMVGIDKRFPGVHALKNIDFSIRRGEIHGLLGENGAGKSTLMKVLGGVERMDAGQILIDGEKVSINNPKEAQVRGVSFIHQELSLFLDLDIATNIFIQDLPKKGSYVLNKELKRKTAQVLAQVGLSHYAPGELIKNLQMGERQLVEIARCLTMQTKILVLDEPTSSLTKKEVETLFGLMHKLREQGISIIFISHRLDEVFEICDRLTIMRDGQKVATRDVKSTTTNEVVSLMIGRELEDMFSRRFFPQGKEILRVENLTRGERFRNISFSVHEGEIVGLYGLMGSGRSEIVRSIFGLEKFDSGEIYMEGKKISPKRPLDAIKSGIGLITENRREEGLMVQQTVQFNLVAANLEAYRENRVGFMSNKKEVEACNENISELNIKTSSLSKKVQYLSGGNQQKIVIAKWLNRSPRLLILDEPTRGVDVGAKYEIYSILENQIEGGKGVFVISSELNEIMGLCDRILVIRKGEIVKEFHHEEFKKEELLEACMGGNGDEH